MKKKELKKILYVEDNRDIQKIVSYALENIGGYELKICSSGKGTIDEAKKFNPDLFLLDVVLPDMSGPSILKEIRNCRKFENTPVIFISAKYVGHELVLYRRLKALGIIRKPFDPITLANTIEDLYNNSHQLETPDDRSYIVL